MSIVQHQSNEVAGYDPAEVARYLGLNPNSPADRAMVAVCERYDFDPVLKHVVVIPKGGVYVTRDGLLHVAHRSGQLDGIVVDQDPTLVDGEWVSRVSVYRKDMRHPFTYPGRYPVNGGNRQYAQEMALKAAEAHALRRAFDVTGLPTLDEQRPEATHVAPGQASAERLRAALGTTDHQGDAEASRPDATSAQAPTEDGGSVEREAGRTPSAAPPPDSPLLDVRGKLAKHMFAVLNDAGLGGKSDEEQATRLAEVSAIIGRTVTTSKELTDADAEAIIATLEVRAAEPVDVTEGEIVEADA